MEKAEFKKVFKDDLVEVTYLRGKKIEKTGQMHKILAERLEAKGYVKIGKEVPKKKKSKKGLPE